MVLKTNSHSPFQLPHSAVSEGGHLTLPPNQIHLCFSGTFSLMKTMNQILQTPPCPVLPCSPELVEHTIPFLPPPLLTPAKEDEVIGEDEVLTFSCFGQILEILVQLKMKIMMSTFLPASSWCFLNPHRPHPPCLHDTLFKRSYTTH